MSVVLKNLQIFGYIFVMIPIACFAIYQLIRFIYGVFEWGTFENGVIEFIIQPIIVGILWWCGIMLIIKDKIGVAWPMVLLLGVIIFGLAFIVYGRIIPQMLMNISPFF